MRASKFLSRLKNISDRADFGELTCERCKDRDGLSCEHDFESDPKVIWEVIYCVHCGEIVETADVTRLYEAEALRQAEDAEECLHEETENLVCNECGELQHFEDFNPYD